MDDLIQVCGLADIIGTKQIDRTSNFETIYSDLYDRNDETALAAISERVTDYFGALRLHERPTIYDVLVLSLRSKDIIATFNWDPFLYQACLRNHRIAKPPHCVYLHGNVAIGYCLTDRRMGQVGQRCQGCGNVYEPSRLLYPIKHKGYASDPFLSAQWNTLRSFLKDAFMLTIFGYGAPSSDVEAVDLMSSGWGKVEDRNLEQTELIDIKDEEVLLNNWQRFIHTHHYDLSRDFYDSWLAYNPRRTGEIWWQRFFEVKWVTKNQIPQFQTLPQMWDWFQPLLDAEISKGSH